MKEEAIAEMIEEQMSSAPMIVMMSIVMIMTVFALWLLRSYLYKLEDENKERDEYRKEYDKNFHDAVILLHRTSSRMDDIERRLGNRELSSDSQTERIGQLENRIERTESDLESIKREIQNKKF